MAVDTALVDVDGTLVDSNYQHVIAWQRAFRDNGLTVPAYHIHRAVGMGGDHLVPALAGDEVERNAGDQLRDAWRRHFDPLLDEVSAVPGATELLRMLHDAGLRVALASSSPAEHLDRYLALLDPGDAIDAVTTADDVASTKPAPDILEVALRKVDGSEAIVIGDSTWDCEAALRLRARPIAVRTGGFSREELLEAGALDVHDSLPALAEWLNGQIGGWT